MKISLPALIVLLSLVGLAQGAEPVAKRYLIDLFDAKGDDLAKICHPTDDLWMLGALGGEDELTALKALDIESKKTGIVSAHFGHYLIFVETRDDKIDPSFNLETEYEAQKVVVKRFIAATLTRDQEMIRELVVDPSNVQIEGPTAVHADMDVYYMVIEAMPVIRASKPSEDAKTKTITYRIPIGDDVQNFTLTKVDGRWKIATSKKVRVPLQWFFK